MDEPDQEDEELERFFDPWGMTNKEYRGCTVLVWIVTACAIAFAVLCIAFGRQR